MTTSPRASFIQLTASVNELVADKCSLPHGDRAGTRPCRFCKDRQPREGGNLHGLGLW
jgi:hypothetical protein